MDTTAFFNLAVQISVWLVVAATALTFLRLARGPSLADRVVALDMMTILIVSFCALEVLATGVLAFLDVALALAVVGFLATVALARFAERRQARRRDSENASGPAIEESRS